VSFCPGRGRAKKGKAAQEKKREFLVKGKILNEVAEYLHERNQIFWERKLAKEGKALGLNGGRVPVFHHLS